LQGLCINIISGDDVPSVVEDWRLLAVLGARVMGSAGCVLFSGTGAATDRRYQIVSRDANQRLRDSREWARFLAKVPGCWAASERILNT
jgi:hypothetical protein